MVALEATPRIGPRCTWQVVEGEAVLLDLQGERLLELNRAGSWLLPFLEGERTVPVPSSPRHSPAAARSM